MVALASIWTIFLLIGLVAAFGPSACAFSKACEDVVSTFVYHQRPAATSNIGLALNASVTVALGFAVGIPVTTAACKRQVPYLEVDTIEIVCLLIWESFAFFFKFNLSRAFGGVILLLSKVVVLVVEKRYSL